VTYRRYRSAPPWRRVAAFLALLVAAVAASAAARADRPAGWLGHGGEPRLANGVAVGGTLVGGMTREQATTALEASYRRPVALTVAGKTVFVSPARAGGVALVSRAVERALTAKADETVPLRVLIDRPRLVAFANRLARRLSQPAVDAQVRLHGVRPVVSKEKDGLTVRARPLVRALEAALRINSRGPLAISFTAVRARVTRADLRSVIVIQRSANRLRLYDGRRRVETFGVATGQPSYPTPLGRFTIVSKQMNPWWYPPDSDWAAGLAPVPPGPGNPLGTRWMGLSVPGVGIHGTPDAASIGYSASHGCIRMRIPDAEWLFTHVSLDTTVFIVP
jgi:lipoprotein-anchoring transpeptidase ErfK/SrfK